ncbi:MAG: glycine cleavage system protein GcvH [Planctomycetota bacterium]|nr:glycine cleavage system protein GcvH [Planctomycetota bacterium]
MSTQVPAGLKYSKEHEWVKLEGQTAAIGITDHAQHELGDIVFVELPKVGGSVTFMKPFGTVESVKAASDLFSPVTGKVVAINPQLDGAPETVNKDPYGAGWMIKVELADAKELEKLLDDKGYLNHLGQA